MSVSLGVRGNVVDCHATQDGSVLLRVQLKREIVVVSSRFEISPGSTVMIVGEGSRRRLADAL
jgi:hypothetical protein